MMMYKGKPVADMTEGQLADAAADLITHGNSWGDFFIMLETTRFWIPKNRLRLYNVDGSLREPPVTIDWSWRALCRGIDKVTNRALTRLYFALRAKRGGDSRSRILTAISEAVDVPVSPWGVMKPTYGERIFRGPRVR